MKDLFGACQALVEQGLAERVGVGQAIRVTAPIDPVKYAEVNRRYGGQFDRRWEEHRAKEREAEKRFRDFVINH